MNNPHLDPRNAKAEQEAAALRAKVETLLAEGRAMRKDRKRQLPLKYQILLCLAIVSVVIAVKLYSDPRPWPTVLMAMFDHTWDHWRHASWITWVAVAIIVAFSAYVTISTDRQKRRRRAEEAAEAAWYRTLAPLIDISDYPDRDDLYFYLEPAQRPRLLDALRRMPRGSRSLRAAVATIDPDLLDEPA